MYVAYFYATYVPAGNVSVSFGMGRYSPTLHPHDIVHHVTEPRARSGIIVSLCAMTPGQGSGALVLSHCHVQLWSHCCVDYADSWLLSLHVIVHCIHVINLTGPTSYYMFHVHCLVLPNWQTHVHSSSCPSDRLMFFDPRQPRGDLSS